MTEKDPEIKLPIMTLKNRYVAHLNHIHAGCPASEALFELIGRATIKPSELPLIHKMGFSIKIIGDTKEITKSPDAIHIEKLKVLK